MSGSAPPRSSDVVYGGGLPMALRAGEYQITGQLCPAAVDIYYIRVHACNECACARRGAPDLSLTLDAGCRLLPL